MCSPYAFVWICNIARQKLQDIATPCQILCENQTHQLSPLDTYAKHFRMAIILSADIHLQRFKCQAKKMLAYLLLVAVYHKRLQTLYFEVALILCVLYFVCSVTLFSQSRNEMLFISCQIQELFTINPNIDWKKISLSVFTLHNAIPIHASLYCFTFHCHWLRRRRWGDCLKLSGHLAFFNLTWFTWSFMLGCDKGHTLLLKGFCVQFLSACFFPGDCKLRDSFCCLWWGLCPQKSCGHL